MLYARCIILLIFAASFCSQLFILIKCIRVTSTPDFIIAFVRCITSWQTYINFRYAIITQRRKYIWQGHDTNGVKCCIAQDQWEQHVYKRPDIEHCLALTIRAMQLADLEKPDYRHLDENGRRL